MSHVTLYTADIASTGNATYDAFTTVANGVVIAVQHVYGNITSTATITVASETNDITYILSNSATTGNWTRYPRFQIVNRHGTLIGATTDYQGVELPIVEERFKVSIAGATSDGVAGEIKIFVAG